MAGTGIPRSHHGGAEQVAVLFACSSFRLFRPRLRVRSPARRSQLPLNARAASIRENTQTVRPRCGKIVACFVVSPARFVNRHRHYPSLFAIALAVPVGRRQRKIRDGDAGRRQRVTRQPARPDSDNLTVIAPARSH